MAYSDPYLYDPRQTFNPEDVPPPPGYGEPGGNYLLPDENVKNPTYLPQNSAGMTNFPGGPEYGPPPPTYYATNIPDTAKKWGDQGQDYTFLAESPGAAKTAQELGAPNVMKGYDPALDQAKAIGPEPKPGELDEMSQLKQLWGHYVADKYQGIDPTTINPAEEGMKAGEAARNKYALELLNRTPGSVDYKQYEKLIADAEKNAEKNAEWQRRMGEEDKKMAQDFFKSKLSDQRKIAGEDRRQKDLDTLANVDKAQKYTQATMEGANAPWNYELSPEELRAAIADPTVPLTGKRLKPLILTNINRERDRAGLPPIVEKELPASKEYTDWGLFKTGEKTTKQYGYEEGQTPARRSATVPRGTTTGGGTTPPLQVLKEGTATHFKNGQIWALQGGRPVRIK